MLLHAHQPSFTAALGCINNSTCCLMTALQRNNSWSDARLQFDAQQQPRIWKPQQERRCLNQRRWNCKNPSVFRIIRVRISGSEPSAVTAGGSGHLLFRWGERLLISDSEQLVSFPSQPIRASGEGLREVVLDLLRTETLPCLDTVSLQPFVLFCSVHLLFDFTGQPLKVQYVKKRSMYCVEEISVLSALQPEKLFFSAVQSSRANELTS